ncbi:MAG: serine/threonine-protein phosphatase [Sphingomonas sp.]|uniref:PP2C family protein-serine/threonine phosphatase n=1 Tax=Sphingomonas sp. TaxID=28214 RepID=UPI001AC9A90A|nr:protein phosphatase 2C domain-containing protein [Sphingomonas sp.]MBN8809360.1 serine/threonine-protein phosphatase [Sphingomonas sp.]
MTAQPIVPLRADGPTQAYVSVARSHVGRVRLINEDRVLDCPTASLWAVADGMGGHSGGDLAAQAVVDRLRGLALSGRTLALTDILVALSQANADICRRNRAAASDAGTTVVAATILDGQIQIAWAGDSRAYRLRDGRLDLLTRDHSVVQELVDAGLITPAQAERHPSANVITRALGIGDRLDCETMTADWRPGDRLLLCSDGLSRSMAADDRHHGTDTDIADALMAAALDRDGSDNVSLVLVG